MSDASSCKSPREEEGEVGWQPDDKGKDFLRWGSSSCRAGETQDGVQSWRSPVCAEGVGGEDEARREAAQLAWEAC